jgi:hypothetical protein
MQNTVEHNGSSPLRIFWTLFGRSSRQLLRLMIHNTAGDAANLVAPLSRFANAHGANDN